MKRFFFMELPLLMLMTAAFVDGWLVPYLQDRRRARKGKRGVHLDSAV